MDIYELIDPAQPLDAELTGALRQAVEECPFHHAARILYVAALYQAHSPQFGEELRKAALLVPDPSVLFRIVETQAGATASAEPPKGGESPLPILTEDDDRTTSLIDQYLTLETPSEDDPAGEEAPRQLPTLSDVTSDYAAFLSQRPDVEPAPPAPADSAGEGEGDLLDRFIASTRGKQRYNLIPTPDAGASPNPSDPPIPAAAEGDTPADVAEGEDNLYNERVVDLLIQQGEYVQALEILRRICRENPQKNLTFAARLRLLEAVTAK